MGARAGRGLGLRAQAVRGRRSRQADGHARVDNATEIALRTYLGLHKDQRGGPKWDPGRERGFSTLLDGLAECFHRLPDGITRADLLWFHEVRNTLHHRGNGLAPDTVNLQKYLAATEALLRFLFGDAPVDAAINEQAVAEAEQALPTAGSLPLPAEVLEVDSMIERIRLLAAHLPEGAPQILALPGDADELISQVSDRIGELGMEWGADLQEQTAEYCGPLSDPERSPGSAEEAIEELLKLRYILLYALT